MKVAFISDIHSNPDALRAVLQDIQGKSVNKMYCLGDIIGYHTKPNEVISLLKEAKIESITGNHDLDVLNKKFNSEKEPDIFKWTYDELTDESKDYLTSLPEEILTTIEGWKIRICHGSPESVELYCYEESDYSKKMIETIAEDILVCGHTHLPYAKAYDGKYILNSGSIGKPKIGRPNASYMLVEFLPETISPEIIEVPYDYEAMASHVENRGFEKYATHLRTGIVS